MECAVLGFLQLKDGLREVVGSVQIPNSDCSSGASIAKDKVLKRPLGPLVAELSFNSRGALSSNSVLRMGSGAKYQPGVVLTYDERVVVLFGQLL